MDYWLENAPVVTVSGENIRVTTDRSIVMSRAVALRTARALLACVAQLEDRAHDEPTPIRCLQ